MTDCSSLTGFSSTSADSAAVCVAAPQGTSGAQMTRFSPSSARSWNDSTPAGLPGGTTISRVFEAKVCGSEPCRSSAVSFSMLASSADAKTSAGAPSWIWATRSEEPAKLNSTFTPSWVDSNSSPICSNAAVRDEAAYTVRVVSSAAESSGSSDPHPADAAMTRAAIVPVSRRFMTLP